MSEQVAPGDAGAERQEPQPVHEAHEAQQEPKEQQAQTPPEPRPAPGGAMSRRPGLRAMIAAGLGAGVVVGVVAAFIFAPGAGVPFGAGMFGLAFLGLYNPFMTLLVLIAIGFAVWYFVTPPDRRRLTQAPNTAALEILRQRFARGEIDQEEYRQRSEVLRRG